MNVKKDKIISYKFIANGIEYAFDKDHNEISRVKCTPPQSKMERIISFFTKWNA